MTDVDKYLARGFRDYLDSFKVTIHALSRAIYISLPFCVAGICSSSVCVGFPQLLGLPQIFQKHAD